MPDGQSRAVARRRGVYRRANLLRLIEPQSVAVVGVSANGRGFGAATLNNLKPFAGRVYAVNPKVKRIGDVASYASMVELLRDTALALAPVTRAEAWDMLHSLKGAALLEGFRGSEPVNMEALADIVCRVGEMAADLREKIAEIDINPVICTHGRIVAVDALIVKKA